MAAKTTKFENVQFVYSNPFKPGPEKLHAEIKDNKLVIHNELIKMTLKGLPIPPAFKSEFGGKSYVALNCDDPDFIKAFMMTYNLRHCIWKKSS